MFNRICLEELPTRLNHLFRQVANLSLLHPPIAQNGLKLVQEYLPVSHRLRLSASP